MKNSEDRRCEHEKQHRNPNAASPEGITNAETPATRPEVPVYSSEGIKEGIAPGSWRDVQNEKLK